MKKILLLVAILMLAACGPARQETPRPLAIGDRMETIYLIDLGTGKCVSMDGMGKYNPIYIVQDYKCKVSR